MRAFKKEFQVKNNQQTQQIPALFRSLTTILLGVLALASAACSATLTPEAKHAKLMKADPPESCEELGDVSGSAWLWCDLGCQKTRMRNEAAELGANYVRYDAAGPSGSSGTAFRCP